MWSISSSFKAMFDLWRLIDIRFENSLLDDLTIFFKLEKEKFLFSHNKSDDLTEQLIRSLEETNNNLFVQRNEEEQALRKNNRKLEVFLQNEEEQLIQMKNELEKISANKQQADCISQVRKNLWKLSQKRKEIVKQ